MVPASVKGNKIKKVQPFGKKRKVPPRAVDDAGPRQKIK